MNKNVTKETFIERATQYAKAGYPHIALDNLRLASEISPVSDEVREELQGYVDEAVAKKRQTAHANTPRVINRRDFSEDKREALAQSGAALPDGSFPIENAADLKNAIKLAGLGKNPSVARAHIKKRAAALGFTQLLPDTAEWKSLASVQRSKYPDWYVDRFWNRYAEARQDMDLIEKHGEQAKIDRPAYFPSSNWMRMKPIERTLGAEIRRRQIVRNYNCAADELFMGGWTGKSIGEPGSELIFSRSVPGEGGGQMLVRAILVRKKDLTEFYPKVVTNGYLGSQYANFNMAPDEVRL